MFHYEVDFANMVSLSGHDIGARVSKQPGSMFHNHVNFCILSSCQSGGFFLFVSSKTCVTALLVVALFFLSLP